MHHRYIFKLAALVPVAAILVVAFNNCGQMGPNEAADQSTVSGLASCPTAPVSLQNPKTIKQTIDLVNALPKPLTIDCFLANLSKPFDVFAVNNAFSAQPSAGPKSPRILIIRTPLVLSVVPAGSGRLLLEMSEIVDTVQSVKGELAFPIYNPVVMEDAFTHLLQPAGVTDCRFCHSNETAAGPSFSLDARKSNILRPDSLVRITSASLKQEATSCNPIGDQFRCNMLEAIFIKGQGRDASFP